MRILVFLLSAFLVNQSGCHSTESECTLEALTSVGITVRDTKGAPVPDAKVTYEVDGGPKQAATNASGGNYGAGEEQAGVFTIQATSADGTKHAETSVTVEADECHVHPQSVTLTLK